MLKIKCHSLRKILIFELAKTNMKQTGINKLITNLKTNKFLL